jgi:anti-anti-sigma factor
MSAFSIEFQGRRCTITMHTDLTAAVVADLQTALRDSLDKKPEEVIFDLAASTMLDSSGIGLLIATYNTAAQMRCRLEVHNVSARILKLLQHMRLASRLNAKGAANEDAHG